MEIEVKLAGTKALVLGSIEAADPRSPYYQEMLALRETKSKDRTPSWYSSMERLQFLSSFYSVPEINGTAIPQGNFRQSIIDTAKSKRLGSKAQGAISVALDPASALLFDGWEHHWSPEDLYKQGDFTWTRMLRARTGAGLSTYPRFPVPWALTVTMNLDETVLSVAKFWELCDLAGRITGIGACRKLGYGRFAIGNMPKTGAT